MKNYNILITVMLTVALFALSCNSNNSALRIKANQKNAVVIIDSKEAGTTPIDVMVERGKHTVEIKLVNEDSSFYYYSQETEISENVISKGIYAELELKFTEVYYWYKANTIEAIDSFVTAYPESKYVQETGNKKDSLNWNEVKTVADIDAYIKDYPESKFSSKAEEKKENIYFSKIESSTIAVTVKSRYNEYIAKYPNGKYKTKADSILNSFSGTFTDKRNGKKYKWVKIGKQVWMAQNLAYKKSSGCWAYRGNSSNVSKYGYLYTWQSAKNAVPAGWHLPTDKEWTTLINTLGGEKKAGGKLKSTTGWNSPNKGATNSSGFSALASGLRSFSGSFDSLGTYAFWWNSTAHSGSSALCRYLDSDDIQAIRFDNYKSNGFSVRCIRN